MELCSHTENVNKNWYDILEKMYIIMNRLKQIYSLTQQYLFSNFII